MQDLNIDIAALFESHESERFSLHTRRLNEQMVRVLRTIGYDVGFCKGSGQYLFDRAGSRYLDLLSGFGVFAVGRNHPAIRAALKSVLDADLPNLVQMDVSTLAGILAERLLALVPHLDKAFFANSGAESVEAAIKLRARRPAGPASFFAITPFMASPMARFRSTAMTCSANGSSRSCRIACAFRSTT
jgi:ornithine--oxo-acid transaminase